MSFLKAGFIFVFASLCFFTQKNIASADDAAEATPALTLLGASLPVEQEQVKEAAAEAADPLPPIVESQAYKAFLKKPVNNLSKMFCILNYFRPLSASVRYEGIDYPMAIAYPAGMIYLMTHYKKEEPVDWAEQNCYRSLIKNEIIYLKLEDGEMLVLRDVLLNKFAELEKAIAAGAQAQGDVKNVYGR